MNRDIIVYIILQEFKHRQLIAGLKQMTFESPWYDVSLLEVIQPLMGIPMQKNGDFPEISDRLAEVYYDYLEEASQYKVQIHERILEKIAEECYEAILSIIHLDTL